MFLRIKINMLYKIKVLDINKLSKCGANKNFRKNIQYIKNYKTMFGRQIQKRWLNKVFSQ